MIENLPKKISVFPLSNFIIFPNTSVPLNIFEKRYINIDSGSQKINGTSLTSKKISNILSGPLI